MSNETIISKYPLKKEKIIKKTMTWLLVPTFLTFTILIILIFVVNVIEWLFIILISLITIAVLIAGVYWYQTIYYKNYFYDLTEDGLIIKKGVISSNSTTLPPKKVQDVYLDQDILDRIFGLWDLHMSTATDVSGTHAHIDGVSEENGRALREILLKSFSMEEEEHGNDLIQKIQVNRNGFLKLSTSTIMGYAVAIVFIPFLLPLFLIAFPLTLIWNYLEFKSIEYELRKDGVFIKRGFLTPRESIFFYRNIQDVLESQDFMDLIFGVRTITIKTTTTRSAQNALMPYINVNEVHLLKEKILNLSIEKLKTTKTTPKTTKALTMEAKQRIEEQETPYKNQFLKSALFSSIYLSVLLAVLVIFCMLIAFYIFNINSSLTLGTLILFLGSAVIIASSVILAVFNHITYKYSVSPEFITTKYGIINVTKKQINYAKIQDLEKLMSFTDSLIGLASIKLETGSKEFVENRQATMAANAIESIPVLGNKDAEALKQTILSKTDLTLPSTGKNSLVNKIPLESIKPIKKTIWHAVSLLIPLIIINAMVLVFSPNHFLLLLILSILVLPATIAVKFAYEHYYLRSYFYDLNNDVLVIKKGVFGSREIILPFEKIQDVFVDQDILDKFFGLRDVYVSTITNRSILNAHIDGVNSTNAEKIALLILEKINTKMKKV